jgi:hypothetical protein
MTVNRAASVHNRLLNLSRERHDDFNLMLIVPKLRAYPRATVVAEKLETIAKLGMVNSRMKDYFDLSTMALERAIDPEELAQAIARTFSRRRTPLPDQMPAGLTDEFAQDSVMQKRWKAYLDKNGFEPVSLQNVIADIRSLVEEPLLRACNHVEND